MPIVKLVFDIDQDLRNQFKSKLALRGETIKGFFTKAIEDYLRETKMAPQKGRRR